MFDMEKSCDVSTTGELDLFCAERNVTESGVNTTFHLPVNYNIVAPGY